VAFGALWKRECLAGDRNRHPKRPRRRNRLNNAEPLFSWAFSWAALCRRGGTVGGRSHHRDFVIDWGRIAGLNRAAAGAYSRDARAATNFRGAEKSRIWLGCRYSVARWRNGSSQRFYYGTRRGEVDFRALQGVAGKYERPLTPNALGTPIRSAGLAPRGDRRGADRPLASDPQTARLRNPLIGLRKITPRCQRSTLTVMLRPISSAMVAVCANSFANAGSFANPSCALPYTSQLA
jgi:hypothetical protein